MAFLVTKNIILYIFVAVLLFMLQNALQMLLEDFLGSNKLKTTTETVGQLECRLFIKFTGIASQN